MAGAGERTSKSPDGVYIYIYTRDINIFSSPCVEFTQYKKTYNDVVMLMTSRKVADGMQTPVYSNRDITRISVVISTSSYFDSLGSRVARDAVLFRINFHIWG